MYTDKTDTAFIMYIYRPADFLFSDLFKKALHKRQVIQKMQRNVC